MTLTRPAPGAPFDKRLTATLLEQLLQAGPRAFDPATDIDLLDYVEQFIAARLLVAPTVAGLTYAPGVGDIVLTGPEWPLTAFPRLAGSLPAASLSIVGGEAVLAGNGVFYSSAPLSPVPAGRTSSAVLEFKVDAPAGEAVYFEIGGLYGTVAQPLTLESPFWFARGWKKLTPDLIMSGPVLSGSATRLDASAVGRVVTNTGGVQDSGGSARGEFGSLLFGRWYRLEILRVSATSKHPATLYDAATGETVAALPDLYFPPSPRLGIQLGGAPVWGTPDTGYAQGVPTVTVRRWQEWRPTL